MEDKGYKRTSVHLTAELAERVDASGSKLPDLIRKGLDAEPLEDMIRRVIREALGAPATESLLRKVVREELAREDGMRRSALQGAVPFREPGQ